MLESLLGGRHTKWAPPPMDANTLFRLVDFTATTDIVDRGPNAIAVARNGAPAVGTDDIYSYILFNGGKYLTFNSSTLNRTNVELTWVIGSVVKLSSQYGEALLDTRPASTNGNYHILTINQQVQPITLNYNYPSSTTTGISNTGIDNGVGPFVVKLQLRDTGTKLYVNGVLLHDVATVSALNTANLKIGRSAFYPTVPDLQLRLYFFEIKALT